VAEALNHAWRLMVTGAAFLVFGLGGLVLSLLVMPLLHVLPGGTSARVRRARRLISACFAGLVRALQAFGVMRVAVHHMDRLDAAGPMLVLANHPTYLDVVVLIAHMKDANCVVKSSLWRNPFYGGIVRAAGYVRNDDPSQLVDACVASFAQQAPLLIFPEGTRSVPGRPLHFVRGAAHIALRSGATLLPIVIHCDPPTLGKGQPWYRIPPRAFRITIDVHEPRSISEWATNDAAPSICARRLTETLEHYFSGALQADERTAG
jgi:1-acyl-sn-glycerol-3-phosphate acyltransferase